jgi:hypothetical protein
MGVYRCRRLSMQAPLCMSIYGKVGPCLCAPLLMTSCLTSLNACPLCANTLQASDNLVHSLHERLAATEQRQQVLLNFFANALKEPRILHRLLSSINPNGGVQRIGPGPGAFERLLHVMRVWILMGACNGYGLDQVLIRACCMCCTCVS